MENSLYGNMIRTEKGMVTHGSSGTYLLDMFYSMGAVRYSSEVEVENLLIGALQEDQKTALALAFHNRNIRGGQGERRSFRIFLKVFAELAPDILISNLHLVPVYGRWDDLLVLFPTPIGTFAMQLIGEALFRGDKLCAKWMPREGKNGFEEYGKPLAKFLGLSYKKYRKLLAGNTNVVEQVMCRGEWDAVKYEHVPAKAMLNYRKAFLKHDGERYTAYLLSVEKGEKKINAGTLHPHELVKSYLSWGAYDKQIELQWNALPNYIADGLRFLPVVDVSGSMFGLPLQVAISLGIYLSERNTSVFKNAFLTFSEVPQLVRYDEGITLHEKVETLSRAHWGFTTDLNKVFEKILYAARTGHVRAEDMPTHIIILSDMQFDTGVRVNNTALENIDYAYLDAGYRRPQVIFWNLRDANGVPATQDENGVALLSGFSSSAMKTILAGAELSPYSVMMDTLKPYLEEIKG